MATPNGVWLPADRVLATPMRILMDLDLSTLSFNTLNDLWANTEAIVNGQCYCDPPHSEVMACPEMAPAGVVRAKLEIIRDDRLRKLQRERAVGPRS